MKTFSTNTLKTNWLAAEMDRHRQTAMLVHVFALRDDIVTLPNGWGSWCYSIGFQDNVAFTDMRNFAGDGVQERTYAPAAIDLAAKQDAFGQTVGLDPRTLKMVVDPALDPWANYVNDVCPLRFACVIYRVHRDGNAVKTVSDGAGHDVPLAQVASFGFMTTVKDTIQSGQSKLAVEFVTAEKLFERKGPNVYISTTCPKKLFSTGPACLACNADKEFVRLDGVVTAISQNKVRAVEWGAQDTGWFADGLVEYEAVEPVSGLTFGLSIPAIASEKIADEHGDPLAGDLTLAILPWLIANGTTARAFGGCDKSLATCKAKHRPVGLGLTPADGNLRNFGGEPGIPIEPPAFMTSP